MRSQPGAVPTLAGVEQPGDPSAQPASSLLDLLHPEALDRDLFRGANPDTWPGGRVFGGLVAAQSLRAAIDTVETDHAIHSFHSYFVRAGRTGQPIIYSVERIRDGRSFTTRRVTAVQDGEAIFTMDASFHRWEEGDADYQLALPPGTPGPEDETARVAGVFGEMAERPSLFLPFEMHELGPTEPEPDGSYRSTRRVWMRCSAELPEDPAVHACALTFASDMAVVLAARPPVPSPSWEGFMGASLDHAVWFHRPVRMDEWLFYDLHAVSNNNSRGLARGLFHDRDGRLVASMTQEALIRTIAPPPAG